MSQPRWPRGAPDDEKGHGQGGRFAPVGTPGTGGWLQIVSGRMTRGWANDDRARQELARIGTTVLTDVTPATHLDGGQMAQVHRIDLPDGRSVVAKWYAEEIEVEPDYDDMDDEEFDEAYGGVEFELVDLDDAEFRVAAEISAARVAEAIGARVPPVVLDPRSQAAVLMGFVDGVSGDRYGYVDWDAQPLTGAGGDAYRLGLLDLLIANGDRHLNNWLMDGEGRPVGIDHGNAELFESDGDVPLPTTARQIFSGGSFAPLFFDQDDYDVLTPNPFHPDDFAELRRRLQALHEKLDQFGRPAFLTVDDLAYMMAVLDLLEPHAKGERRLIP